MQQTLNGLSVDHQGGLYAFTAGGIAHFAPGSALPSDTVPLSLSYPFSLFTSRSGEQYLLNGTAIIVYAAGGLATGTVARQIGLGRTMPVRTPLEIAADSTGAIYVLYSDGSLGLLPADASGTVTPTLVPSLKFSTKQDQNAVMAVDSQNRVYLFDASNANQVDIGQTDASGNFAVVATLTDANLALPATAPVTLAVDAIDAFYLFGVNGAVDFYRSGARGAVSPDVTFNLPIPLCCGAAAMAVPSDAAFPSPPPTPGIITFSPASVSVTQSSPSQSVTVSESGFNGTFKVLDGSCIDENASPHTTARVNPTQGKVFTVTGVYGSYAIDGTCTLDFYDGQGARAYLKVSVAP
jgi:hypothetical protein